MNPLPVSFLTDFGLEDEFVGVCRAVIHSADPEVKVIDVTHGIAAGDVRAGSIALASFVAYSSPAVHLAVVDPGVGTDRRAVALVAGDHFLVGPDNGLLIPAAQRLGGPSRAFEISNSPARLTPTHRTFHGRDLFSPVAAELTREVDPLELGVEIDASGLVRIDLPVASLDGGHLTGHVLRADRYGNVALNIGPGLILESFLRDGLVVEIACAGKSLARVPFGSTFADVGPGEPILFTDSSGALSLAINRGDAVSRFALAPDQELQIRPAGPE